jgi:hypothetical protein
MIASSVSKTGQDRIREFPVSELKPSPENDKLYKPVDPTDSAVIELANSIIELGVKEPLVISLDGYIISGHRRYAAARLAQLEMVPCRVEAIFREGNSDAFVALLREYNRQRVKNHQELLREELVSMDPAASHRRLVEYRDQQSVIAAPAMKLGVMRNRAEISAAKQPMLMAVTKVIAGRRKFWPLSNRQIHYALLNAPPLRHKSKPDSRYVNDSQSYKDLCDLLTRARLTGDVPMESIDDPTRPIYQHSGFDNSQQFISRELRTMFNGYRRDLLQSQPNHIEVLVEKNTVSSICKPICQQYCVPMTSMRGFCSTPPRRDMAERYHDSGKDKLVVLILSDLDPDGESIAESFARSMRDDFEIDDVSAFKVALTHAQAKQFALPEDATAKTGSATYRKFVKKYGPNVWELEALPPETLQSLLGDAIVSVLDMDAFNEEVAAEAVDAAFLESVRSRVSGVLKDIDFGGAR